MYVKFEPGFIQHSDIGSGEVRKKCYKFRNTFLFVYQSISVYLVVIDNYNGFGCLQFFTFYFQDPGMIMGMIQKFNPFRFSSQVHTHMRTHTCTQTHTHTHAHADTHTHTCTQTHTHTHAHADTHTHTHTHTHTQRERDTHTLERTHTHTHTHTKSL